MCRGWLLALAIGLAAPSALAHPGLDRDLERLGVQVAERPSDVELRLRRAELSRRRGHLNDALADLRVVEKLDPDNRRRLIERAMVRVEQNRRGAALRDLDAYLNAGPPTVLALWSRGRIHEHKKRLEAAWADYDRAMRIRGNPDIALARGRVDRKLGNLDRAAKGYAEALEELSGAFVIRVQLVAVHRERSRPDDALAALDDLLATAPRARPEWLLTRADLLDELERPNVATAERLRALASAEALIAKRSSPMARLSRARTLLALGYRDAALAEANEVLRANPKLQDALELKRRMSR